MHSRQAGRTHSSPDDDHLGEIMLDMGKAVPGMAIDMPKSGSRSLLTLRLWKSNAYAWIDNIMKETQM